MATLVLLEDGVAVREYPVGQAALRLGRAPGNDVVVDDRAVSSQHAVLEAVVGSGEGVPTEYHLKDLGSTNQTVVNGKAVSHHRLRHKDVVRIGLSFFEFRNEQDQDPERTTKLHKSWIPGVLFSKD